MSAWDAMTAGVQRAGLVAFANPSLVSYTPAGLPALELQGIFRAASQEIDPGSGLAISSTQPELHVRRAHLPAQPTQQDRCTINGTNYRVTDVQPDGEGMLRLRLLKA